MADERVNRRAFFRRGLGELLKPLADAVAPIERTLDEFDKLEKAAPRKAVPLNVWLRPPGAIAESDFRDVCSRCGMCVDVCPASAIKLDLGGRQGAGVPYIDPEYMPCIACEGLKCMHNCPSGAPVPTALFDIDMGTAVWRSNTCRRSDGHDCTICIDQCPLGHAAIMLDGNDIAVNPHGCIGCGMCQHYCPTTPRSIVVIPVAAKQ